MIIHTIVLNMEKNKDRKECITNMLNSINCKYEIITAIDGSMMENNPDCIQLLNKRDYLIGTTFMCVDNKEETWVYDGSVKKSFPNLYLNGHHGTKGLTVSNIKAFTIAKDIECDWLLLLEDDAELDIHVYNKIFNFANKNLHKDIILLDERANGWGGTAGMLYNKKILKTLIDDLHPLSEFSINSMNYGDYNLSNLWDWKLWKYVCYVNKNSICLPCIKSGKFVSTIL